jgi:hypothetical protein
MARQQDKWDWGRVQIALFERSTIAPIEKMELEAASVAE